MKAALAGVFALMAVSVTGVAPVSAQDRVIVTEGHIAQAKAALQLTPEQERHWPRVAAALRSLNNSPAANADADDHGFVQKARSRASSVAAKAAGARRVLAAAGPLIKTLSAEQRQTAASMATSMGFGHLASRF